MLSFNCNSFFKIIFYAVVLPKAGVFYNYTCHNLCLFYSYFPNSRPLLHVLSGSHCIILMIIHMRQHQHPSTPTSCTHSGSPPLPSSLILKEGRTRERKERVGERNGEGKALKWLSIAVSLPAVFPRRVTFAERE